MKNKLKDKLGDLSTDKVRAFFIITFFLSLGEFRLRFGRNSCSSPFACFLWPTDAPTFHISMKSIKDTQRSKGPVRSAAAVNVLSSRNSKMAMNYSPTPKDIDSAVALQSGNAANPTPYWDIGMNGAGQLVQICDTGFDDASCLLRDGPKQGLTGNLSDTLQVIEMIVD